MSQAFPWYPS
jgi:hypothetical protein